MTRKATLTILAIAVVVLLLPAAAVSLGGHRDFPRQVLNPNSPGKKAKKNPAGQVRLYRVDQKKIVALALDEYLVGVLLAEVPSSFEMEALKAQAVVARTYTLRRHRAYGGEGCDKAPGKADICSDSAHCQAWLDPAEAVSGWGAEGENFLKRVKEAVSATTGEVAVYKGELIEAVYHSTCGGKTEASHALWSGGDLPYLQSVDCPYCKRSPYYRKDQLISYARLTGALSQDFALPVASGEQLPLELASETPGGRVASLSVNGTLIEGKEMRRLLDLPSTALTWEAQDGGLLFHIRGRGHGVGLCQYGADGAARKGKNYRQIIMFYYPGSELTKIKP